jgi:hypothetical protein
MRKRALRSADVALTAERHAGALGRPDADSNSAFPFGDGDSGTRRRWVVLGSAGFIGSALCRRLHDAGLDVVGVDAVEAAAEWPTLRADLLVESLSLHRNCATET